MYGGAGYLVAPSVTLGLPTGSITVGIKNLAFQKFQMVSTSIIQTPQDFAITEIPLFRGIPTFSRNFTFLLI